MIQLQKYCLIACRLAVPRPPREYRTVTSRNMRDINPTVLKKDLQAKLGTPDSTADASNTQVETDADVLVATYNSSLRDVLDRHAPLVTRRVRARPSAPWLSESIRIARRSRRRAERRWRKTRLTVFRDIFVKERKTVSKTINDAKREYFSSKIKKAKDSKTLFSITKDLIGASKAKVFPSLYSKNELPQIFSDYFTDKIRQIRDDLDKTGAPEPFFRNYKGPVFKDFKEVTVKDIRDVIMSSPSKSCVLDPLPTNLLKENVDVLAPFVARIVNLSISSGIVPRDLKTAIVTPLLKKTKFRPRCT